MTWQFIHRFPGGWDTTFSPPVEGDFFKLLPSRNLNLNAEVIQGRKMGDEFELFGLQPVQIAHQSYPASSSVVIFAPCPPPFEGERRIGLRLTDGYRVPVDLWVWDAPISQFVLTP